MSQSRFAWTEPALCTSSKGWFVYFDMTDTLTLKTVRKQFRGGINRIPNLQERTKAGNALRLFWQKKLREGYNPFCQDAGVMKMPYHYTVEEAFDKMLQIKLPFLRTRSKETYTSMVKFFKEWLHAQRYAFLPLSEFTETMAIAYLDHLITVRKYSARTHNDHLVVLKTFYNVMLDRDWVTKSPFKKIKCKPVEIGRNIAYSDEELTKIREHLKKVDPRLYYFTQIMYYSFIRRSELARLRVRDIDVTNHTITIPADVSKNKSQESVVIPVGLDAIIKEMKLEQYAQSDYVFGRHLLTSSTIYKNVNHISTRYTTKVKKLGLDVKQGLYSWKHTGACKAYYATGKDIYALLRQLRHRDLNTTQIYLKSLGLINNDVFRNAMTG